MSVPSTPTSAISVDKNKKYDRQLRLWGDHGQAKLEHARVCLINASATGTEILKNLVLPGIGYFTIVDGHRVSGEDVGNSFFLDMDSLGKSRAKVATDLLLELNCDVRGDFIDETPEKLLESNPEFFNNYSCVIATNLCERTLLRIGSLLWRLSIPLLVCRCVGFIGYMRLVVEEHTIIESQPDNAHEDLRLDRPFKALSDYVDSINMEKLSNKEHSHTPYIIILMKYIQLWKNQHGGNMPKTYSEKNELKKLIKTGIRMKKQGIPEEEENFDEAVKAVNSAILPTSIPEHVQLLMKDRKCTNITPDSTDFWVMMQALRDFVHTDSNNALPLRGSLPDMTSDTDKYVHLQKMYREKAWADGDLVASKVQTILYSLGKSDHMITDDMIRQFCKNSAFLRAIRCRSLEQEYTPETANIANIASDSEHVDTHVEFYILLRGGDRFYDNHGYYPGYFDDQFESDIIKLKACINNLMQEWGVSTAVSDEYIHEMCRYGDAELHSMAAFIGGCAAQEVTKVLTHQFIPFNNTYIFNGMKCTSTTLEM